METQLRERASAVREKANEAGDSVRQIRRRAGRARRELEDTMDRKMHVARRKVRRGARRIEDGTANVAQVVRRAPLRSVLLTAAAGALVGIGAVLLGRRGRRWSLEDDA